jgi:uncharacterized protein YbjT (DUF2867 family)
MTQILVIGATGTTGRQVVSQLAARNVRVRAMTRSPETASLPPHVDVVGGDLTRPESLDAALDGVDHVFLVWTAPPATVAPALERIAQHARRIVFLSSPHKTDHPLFQQRNPLRELHAEIQRQIQSSGREWTFLRPGMFAANALGWWAPQIRAGDVVRWPYMNVPTAPIHEHDIAAVAVRALCHDGHAGAEYVITGPESLSQSEQVNTIGRVIGRSLRPEEISPEDARRELLAVIPAPPAVKMLLDAWAAAAGRPAYVTSTVAEVTGAPARTFRHWVTDHAADFRA